MKKFALALMASAAMVLGISAVANAGTYPPGARGATTTAIVAGGPFTVTVECAPIGAPVTWEFEGQTLTSICEDDASAGLIAGSMLFSVDDDNTGTASAVFTAPTTPGEYTGTYVGAAVGTFTITVTGAVTPGGGLPATGSNGTSTMTIIAFGLFAVGAGLFGVSQVRRRSTIAA